MTEIDSNKIVIEPIGTEWFVNNKDEEYIFSDTKEVKIWLDSHHEDFSEQ